MPFDPPDVSVVICAYTEKRWAELCAAVGSLERQTLAPREIIVVVDHNPALLARARAQFSKHRVVENDEARGLGGARNSGVRAAQGAIVAFLDDDARAADDWLEKMMEPYHDSKVAGVGGATRAYWQGGKPAWFPDEFGWVVGCSYRGLPEQLAPVRNLHGCNMSYRRDLLNALGGFQLGYGCDETELCIRLQRRCPGVQLLYQPAAQIDHQVTPERATWRYLLSRCYFEGGSKAVVSWLVGSRQGLASERVYALHTLPGGLRHNLGDGLFRRDLAGLARAAAIVAGLGSTALGYVIGKATTRQAARRRGWSGSWQKEPA